jgi:hypothetical protein
MMKFTTKGLDEVPDKGTFAGSEAGDIVPQLREKPALRANAFLDWRGVNSMIRATFENWIGN